MGKPNEKPEGIAAETWDKILFTRRRYGPLTAEDNLRIKDRLLMLTNSLTTMSVAVANLTDATIYLGRELEAQIKRAEGPDDR